MKGSNVTPVKHVPQRTCVACRKTTAKRELVRIVRTPEGKVEIDRGGKKKGRGVYLCPTRECWETGLKKGRVEYSLHTRLDEESREELVRTALEPGSSEEE